MSKKKLEIYISWET